MKLYRIESEEQCFYGVIIANSVKEAEQKAKEKIIEWNIETAPIFKIYEWNYQTDGTNGVLLFS